MSKRIVIGEAEFLEPVDYERMGLYPQEALDAVVGDVIAYPAHWAGFTVARKSAQEVTVSPGRYFAGSMVFESELIQTLNLTVYLPLAASDEKWVALIARDILRTVQEDRAFETSEDPELSIPVNIPTPTVEARSVDVVVQQGTAAPGPTPQPTIAATDACIAFVRLTTQGVQDIVPGEAWRAESLFEVEGRVTVLELRFEGIVSRTEVLETGMTNVNSAVDELRRGMIRPEIFRQVRRDVAAIRRQVNVPEGARSDWYDPGLLIDQWDPTHASWLARIDEGIQFPFSSILQARLEVQNEDDPRVMFAGRRMVPAWDKVKRIANEGGKATRLISQLVHTDVIATKRTVKRTKVSYGPTVNVCENAAEWSKYAPQLQAGATFAKDGETIQSIGFVQDNGNGAAGHNVYAVRTVKKSTTTKTYWDYNPISVGLNGSVYGQTFLVDQPLISPSIELEFAKVGTDGDVHVFFCSTDDTGAPIISDVIAEATLTHAQLKVGWNEFVADLTFFEPGNRYAWFVVTNGNHTLLGTDTNAFTGGTSFRFTDGAWAQGDLTFDFNFRINGCRFRNARTVIDFKPMSLPEGMTQFSLLYPNWEPDGTTISWEFQPVFGGQNVPWAKLEAVAGANPLVGLPAQVNLRATFLTTPDLAPMIELSADAVSKTARVRNTFLAPSDPINFGLTTTTVETYTVIDDFNPAVHMFTPRIMIGNGPALVVPDSSTTVIDADKPTRRAILSIYTVPAGTQIVRNAPGGSTTNIVDVFFVQNTALFAK
jgi:hypothetical protein